MKIFTVNAGSSSLKYALFEVRGKKVELLYKNSFDNHGKAIRNFSPILEKALKSLKAQKIIDDESEIQAVAHRVVHGGDLYTKPTRITPVVLKNITRLAELAPLHNPPNIACILAAQKLFPAAAHVAIFDTAFHQTMPEKAYLYGLPYALSKKLRIRRYGFHGISHAYVFSQARKKLGVRATRRTITCHLGNGCSIAAIEKGSVIDTSMGFTPLEGVPMGTRSGNIDPAIIFHLLRRGYSAGDIEQMLTKKSGLLGVSEISSDVRDLWKEYRKGNKKAVRALEWFAYRIAQYIGGYAAAMSGFDCLVFTGGIGEHAWYLRKWVCAYLSFLKPFRTIVIPTDEERQMAEEVGAFFT